jgi:hypothetical protein
MTMQVCFEWRVDEIFLVFIIIQDGNAGVL